ncbi:MAG: hydroxymethylbilane synthase [Rhodospirillaceae bacterium]|nr:hydroxymethylbilane synthase [Rhodospirillaceae bacterium]
MNTLRIGTRGSALALWQANEVARRMRALPGIPGVEIVTIKTQGDLNQTVPLWATDGRGFFTAELDRALLDKEVDLVVHSLKDLTTLLPNGIALSAVLEREDPRDVLVTRTGLDLKSLPQGASVGTSSLRRRAFLARLRPDLVHLELRGNVPTRLKKLDDGGYDAIVLASAGLKRLELAARITQPLEFDQCPSAVSQGAVAVTIREGDDVAARWTTPLDHSATRIAVTAERAVLRKLEGGCQVPVGGLAKVAGDQVVLSAAVCSIDGKQFIPAEERGAAGDAAAIGARAAEALLARGAATILGAVQAKRLAAATK